MKKGRGWILLIALGLALSAPAAILARSHSPQTASQKRAQKDAKRYNKRMRKAQKHQAKLQKKQMKAQRKQREKWDKTHGTTTVT